MTTVLELNQILNRKGLADAIAQQYDMMKGQRSPQEKAWLETRNYTFATDTKTTSNSKLPWKNNTTIPKMAQIRDNIHANYMSALFPNDQFFTWEAHSSDADEKDKRDAILAYMNNKVRESDFRGTISKLLYDYIDYGNPIADTIWVNESKTDPETQETINGYVGPKLTRVSPLDHVFDASATTYTGSWKITRSIKRFGEFMLEAEQNRWKWIADAVTHIRSHRSKLAGVTRDDWDKATAYSIDGFGSLHEYYGSGFVELLEFEGTIHDVDTDEILDDYIITIIDRTTVIRKQAIPAWKRGGHKVKGGWRLRPDNLYAMGPLENLVGMQYRLDHLQNLAADIRDLTAAPPLVFRGDVQEAVEWAPFAEFHMEVDGDVRGLFTGSDLNGVELEISRIMALMEELVGAPKQAMGIRTPGEKTAHEVQTLDDASGRIFQEKLNQFQIDVVEPSLNNMLEVAVHNMTGPHLIAVMDDDLGVNEFMEITKEDITAKGKLRPIGARHFAAQARLVQNLTGLANSQLWPKIEPHISGKALAKLFESAMQLERHDLMRDNVGVIEQLDTRRLVQQGEEELAVEQATPLEDESDLT